MPTHTESNQSSETRPAIGFGPNRGGDFSQNDYHHPAAGWGAAISVSKVLISQGELIDGTRAVFKMNHENGGYDCPGCAWPDDRKGLRMDICENGIKHATWEMTRKLVERVFFATHTVNELMGWTDYALEAAGRLTEPMRYEAASDKYVPVSWDEAFELGGRHFRGLDNPNKAASTPRGGWATRQRFFTSFSRASWGPTIFRIAPTCVTRQVAGRSALGSALEKGQWTWWIGRRRIASSSWESTPRRTRRGC